MTYPPHERIPGSGAINAWTPESLQAQVNDAEQHAARLFPNAPVMANTLKNMALTLSPDKWQDAKQHDAETLALIMAKMVSMGAPFTDRFPSPRILQGITAL